VYRVFGGIAHQAGWLRGSIFSLANCGLKGKTVGLRRNSTPTLFQG
jgi:hypothetical protein